MNENKDMRMVVIGAGGVGNWLAKGLGMILEYQYPGSALMLVDGDNFEPKNASRQIFSSVGNKANILASEIQPMLRNTFVIPEAKWIVAPEKSKGKTDVISAEELLMEDDIVYATVDNHAARKLVFDAGRIFNNIDIFTGGNDENLAGNVYHYQRRNGNDITEHPAERHDEFIDPPDRNPGEMSCQERSALDGGTQTIAANMAVASFLLGRTYKTILQDEKDEQAEIQFDLALGLAANYDRLNDVVNV